MPKIQGQIFYLKEKHGHGGGIGFDTKTEGNGWD